MQKKFKNGLSKNSLMLVPILAAALLPGCTPEPPSSTQACVDEKGQIAQPEGCWDDNQQDDGLYHYRNHLYRWYYFNGTNQNYPFGTRAVGGSYDPPSTGSSLVHGSAVGGGKATVVGRGFFGGIGGGKFGGS